MIEKFALLVSLTVKLLVLATRTLYVVPSFVIVLIFQGYEPEPALPIGVLATIAW